MEEAGRGCTSQHLYHAHALSLHSLAGDHSCPLTSCLITQSPNGYLSSKLVDLAVELPQPSGAGRQAEAPLPPTPTASASVVVGGSRGRLIQNVKQRFVAPGVTEPKEGWSSLHHLVATWSSLINLTQNYQTSWISTRNWPWTMHVVRNQRPETQSTQTFGLGNAGLAEGWWPGRYLGEPKPGIRPGKTGNPIALPS